MLDYCQDTHAFSAWRWRLISISAFYGRSSVIALLEHTDAGSIAYDSTAQRLQRQPI